MLVRVARVVVGLLGAWGLASCATSSIERLSQEPRVVEAPGQGLGFYTWDEQRGWIRWELAQWGPAEHVRAQSLRAFEAGAYADALAGFLHLENEPPVEGEPPRSDDLGFYIAECYFHLGDYESALPFYQRVYRKDFPDQSLLDEALLRVYRIGMAYLKGEIPCDFFGLVSYSCPAHGIEILASPSDGLITQFPEFRYADVALIEIARHYYDKKEYPEAVPLFDRVAARPTSEWADLAEFQAAMAVHLQIRGVDYDQKTMLEAERRFDAYCEHHPRGGHWQEAREKLREISEMESAKNLKIAKFYLREAKPEACQLYLKEILIKHPNSSAAREARQIQKQLDRARGL
ncbi:MAG: outer membrane protein assembly factor BamD [Planctomycetes bacterium]|nr:outer membrane protein assembly factor BamD [Planctomycetota bacterium]